MSNSRDRRKIEVIMREPLTRHRLMLNSKLRAAKHPENPTPFTLTDLQAFMNGLRGRDVGADPNTAKEIANIMEAVQKGEAPRAPKFDTPSMQLAWGAALGYLSVNPDQVKGWGEKAPESGELRDSDLWKQVTNTRHTHKELLTHAYHVREALRDKSTKYSWAEPGVGFAFDRQKNVIQIDLMQSLIVGFEHARADVYREIGHSLLSVSYPTRMREIYTEMQPLLAKMQKAQGKKGPQLKDDEYKKLRLLSAEWQLRHMMFAAAEENVASRFVSNMALQMLQDYSVSLNNTAVTFRGIGLTRVPKGDGVSEDLRRYMNLCNTVQLSFFQNNALFDDTTDAWFKVGVNPNLVRKTSTLAGRADGKKEDNDGIDHADFKILRQLCGGPDGLENLQPKQHERLYGWSNLTSRIARADAERKLIIEKIWELFAEELIQSILKQTNDEVDQQLKEAKENQKDQDQNQDQDQDGDDQDGDDQDGQDGQEGQEGQDGQSGKPQKGQKGQKGKKSKKERGKPQGDMDDDDSEDADDADADDAANDNKDDQKGDKSKKDKKQKGDKPEKGEKADGDDADANGEDAEGDEQDGEKSGADKKEKSREGKLGADDEDTVPVEGAGDMPAPDVPKEIPADEVDPSADGQDADGEGQDADGQDADGDGQDADGEDADGDAKSQEELEKELREMEAEEEGQDADGQDADGEDADGEDADAKSKSKSKSKSKKPSQQAGKQEGRKLGDLANQDWTNYQKRIQELSPEINRTRHLFKEVQERQLQRKRVKSRKLDILPENGEVMERFNVEAHRQMVLKKKTGQLEQSDLNRFHVDETIMTPTEIDVVIMIDGSGSMSGVPINSALQAAAIMSEAASGKDMRINVYVAMWGDAKPRLLIKPGQDKVTTGQAMEEARKGLNSGTNFAPAAKDVARLIGEERGKSGTLSGLTHVLILSDGEIGDADAARKAIETMFEYTDRVTFDAAIMKKGVGGYASNQMQSMAKSVKVRKTHQNVGIYVGSDPNKIPMSIVGLLLDKVRKCDSFVAVPTSQKRRAMKNAYNKMDRKK